MLCLQVTAYHEAGHTVVMHYTEYGELFKSVTIKPEFDKRGRFLYGYVQHYLEEVTCIIFTCNLTCKRLLVTFVASQEVFYLLKI